MEGNDFNISVSRRGPFGHDDRVVKSYDGDRHQSDYHRRSNSGSEWVRNSGNRGRSFRSRAGRSRNRSSYPPPSRLEAADDDDDMGDGGGGGASYHSHNRNRRQPYGRDPRHSGGVQNRRSTGGLGDRLGPIGAGAQRAIRSLYRGGARGSRNYSRTFRGHSSAQRGGGGAHGSHSGGQPWYKVTVEGGATQGGKDVILSKLESSIRAKITPYFYKDEGANLVFYVVGNQSRTNMIDASRAQRGRLKINIRPSEPQPLDDAAVTLLTEVLSNRYDTAKLLLDLSALQEDKALTDRGYYVPMNQSNSVKLVVDIITQHIPELQCLNLSKNYFSNLSILEPLSKSSNLRRLDLSNNRITRISELDQLTSLQLLELSLNGNPVCDQFNDEDTYVSVIRKKFPKIVRLDGRDLPPVITFDVESSVTSLPPTLPHFWGPADISLGSISLKELIKKFINLYFQLYDTKRDQLMAAYDDDSVFSLAVFYAKMTQRQPSLGMYMDDSRNLAKVLSKERRNKQMKVGKLSITSLLTSLPPSKTDASSFHVDVNVVQGNTLGFMVTGVFEEEVSGESCLRSFSRFYVTNPRGEGLVIRNEQLTITNASPKQIKAHKASNGVSSLEEAPSASAAAVTSPQPAARYTDAQKEELVKRFSEISKMNFAFSKQCLDEAQWDWDEAAKRFTEANSKNIIPPEAFTK